MTKQIPVWFSPLSLFRTGSKSRKPALHFWVSRPWTHCTDRSRRGKTRLAKWYAPYNVSAVQLIPSYQTMCVADDSQDDEKVKLKGEVSFGALS